MTDQQTIPRTAAATASQSRGVPAVSLNLAAARAPMLDVRGAGAAGEGMAALGAGIAKGASNIAAIAAQQAKYITDRHILEAETAMDQVKTQIAVRQIGEPDETQWGRIAEEEMANAEGTILHESLSPDAREHIAARLGRWKQMTLGEVQVSSAAESRKKLTQNLETRWRNFAAKGNREAAHAVIGEMESRGLYGADGAEARRMAADEDVQKVEREARANEVVTIARTQGKAAAIEWINNSDADPVDKEVLISNVNQIHRAQVAEDADKLENAVYSGEIKVPGQVDAWDAGNPRITPKMREQFKAYVAARNDDTRKQNILAQAPELSSRYLSEVRQLDPATATDEDFNALRMKIAELPEGYREIPYSRLMSKFRKADDAPPEVAEVVDNELHSYLEAGLFGAADDPQLMPVPLDAADVYTAEELKKMPVEERITKRESRKAIEDENKRIQARIDLAAKSRKAVIGGKVRRWLDANPKATPEQALQYMRTVLPDSTRAAMFDAFDAPSTVEGNGAEMDLPTRGGPVENTLLPPVLQ